MILHVDMDAFYASIEARDNPELKGHPLIIGGTGKRGVVATANYAAREFGVHSAQPMAVAVRKCPQATRLSPRMSHYADVSREIMEVLHSFSPLVEPLSLDEAFLDMSGTERLFGEPKEAARAIKEAIWEKTELTCSIGIATNKFLAKLASDLDKPDGITVIPPGEERSFIAPLSIRKIWGVGPKTGARLRDIGLETIGDIADADDGWLEQELGQRMAAHIQSLARGIDDRDVVPDRERKSIGSEVTLSEDLHGRDDIEDVLLRRIDEVARLLREKDLRAKGIRVKVRYTETFRLATRQGPLPGACDDAKTLMAVARRLLDTLELDAPIRLVGAAAYDLVDDDEPQQMGLFESRSEKHSRLEGIVDEIRARFGDKIKRGSDE